VSICGIHINPASEGGRICLKRLLFLFNRGKSDWNRSEKKYKGFYGDYLFLAGDSI